MKIASTALLSWLLFVATGLWLAHRQPWLGVAFAPAPDGVAVIRVADGGPAAGRLRAGDIITGISSRDGGWLHLSADDLLAEPTYLHYYREQNAFLERQQRIATVLRSTAVWLRLADGRRIELHPRPRRPLSALPWSFWLQLAVLPGLVFALAARVLQRRPRDPGARYYALSALGAACLVCTYAIYSTRELALPAPEFSGLLTVNNSGGLILLLGSSTSLIWHFPRALGRTPFPLAAYAIAAGFALAHEAQVFRSIDVGLRLPCVLAFGAQSAIAAYQWRRARNSPAQRAMLKWLFIPWFGCSWLYVLLFFLSPLAGFGPQAPQGFGWLLLLAVFTGYAFGLTRFRLYYLNPANVLLWFGSGAAVVALTLSQTAWLGVSPWFATCLALTAVGATYGTLQRWLLSKQRLRHAGFERVLRLVLEQLSGCRHPQQVEQAWVCTLRALFEPRAIDPDWAPEGAVIREADGESLRVSAPSGDRGWRLHYAYAGRGLFTPQDVVLIEHLWKVFHAIAGYWREHLRGQTRERRHLAFALRELIDADLGGLIRAVQRPALVQLARAAQDELRRVLSSISAEQNDVEGWLTHTQREIEQRCRVAGMHCRWHVEGLSWGQIEASRLDTLDGILCEAVTNAIRHSAASRISVTFGSGGDGCIQLVVEDDGVGLSSQASQGSGISNMRRRAATAGGQLTLSRTATGGVRVSVRLPITRSGDAPMTAGNLS